MEATHKTISQSIARKKRGELIFPSDFRGTGTNAAIKKSLSRLAKEGKIKRAAHGIYYKPKFSPLFGELYPNAEDIAEMLAKKERVRIRPAGGYALNRLGLDTQVPTRVVYITDGPPRLFKVGRQSVKFKATTHKKLATKGRISSLVIQSLEELNFNHIDKEMAAKIKEHLLAEDPKNLKHDLALAPIRVHDYIVKLLKK